MRVRPAPGAACLIAALGCAAGMLAIAAPVRAQSNWEEARVTVTLGPNGTARVLQRYRVPATAGRRTFRLLTRPCVVPRDIRLNSYAAEFALEPAEQGPWLMFSVPATAAYNHDSAGFDVSYALGLSGGAVDIPLVHLTQPIARINGDCAIALEVDLRAVPGAAVTFPNVERHGSEIWRATLVAIPSFVRVALPRGARYPGSACAEARQPRDDGGLTWRFWLFVGIMAAWVPLYLAWAHRSGEPGA